MKRKELIDKYLKFFKKNGHAVIQNSSLIPEHDPTVLFTTAGMQPLVPYLLGQPHPSGKRLTNVQKCIRTGDIEDVGDTYHHTFFEMIGNWSLGDYWKKEAIKYSFEFLTKILKIPKERLAITCFKGNKNVPKDNESAKIWKSLGIPKERIAFLENNWWGLATGPCGPNTEMFYWKPNDKKAPKKFDPKDEENWVEIGNNVLITYSKDIKGKLTELEQKSIDFGGGVERTIAVLNGFEDNYSIDTWRPIILEIEKISSKEYDHKENKKNMRIIADHLKAATFILAENVAPSNIERGYVLRRLIRRAIRHAKLLGMEKNFCQDLAQTVIKIYEKDYKEIKKNKTFILTEIEKEENKFKNTLEKGLKTFHKFSGDKIISGKEAFFLYQSHGFPIEMVKELAKEHKIKLDEKGFYKELEKHQKLSRVGAEKKFKGGLADSSEETKKLHTATHLLNEALRQVLGKEVKQRGSNINPERLRFDFSFDRKLTPEEKEQIENIVNQQINRLLDISKEEMTVEKAKKAGAQGVFESKYKEKVSVYSVGDFSKEICGGPHVKNTKELGKFKIKKEESVAAGVRRIKAVLIKE